MSGAKEGSLHPDHLAKDAVWDGRLPGGGLGFLASPLLRGNPKLLGARGVSIFPAIQ